MAFLHTEQGFHGSGISHANPAADRQVCHGLGPPMFLPLLLACPPFDDSAAKDSGLADDSGDSGAEDTANESDFDTDCFAQVMSTQPVCECPEMVFDWSALSQDSAGADFGPSDVRAIHWYIFDMPVSTLNTALCAGGELGMNSFATSSLAGDVIDASLTRASVEIGDWTRQTGVLAFYDVDAGDGAAVWPRAGAVFTFDSSLTTNEVVVAGRGDVYTAP